MIACVACIKKDKIENNTVQYFKENIEGSMKYTDLVKVFGYPDDDIGSGIHIYVYYLKDKTNIWIGYADSIFYVRHMDNDGRMISSIL